MDERPAETGPDNSLTTRRRGRRLVTALAVAGVLAAIPAGAALAGGSDGSTSSGDSAGAVPAQSTTPDDRQRGDGDGDRGDCPEKDGGRQGQGSAQI
jgi:hypothetical protein